MIRVQSYQLLMFSLDLINNAVLSKCKKGVKIVNVARGGIISEEDLLTALNVSTRQM